MTNKEHNQACVRCAGSEIQNAEISGICDKCPDNPDNKGMTNKELLELLKKARVAIHFRDILTWDELEAFEHRLTEELEAMAAGKGVLNEFFPEAAERLNH